MRLTADRSIKLPMAEFIQAGAKMAIGRGVHNGLTLVAKARGKRL